MLHNYTLRAESKQGQVTTSGVLAVVESKIMRMPTGPPTAKCG